MKRWATAVISHEDAPLLKEVPEGVEVLLVSTNEAGINVLLQSESFPETQECGRYPTFDLKTMELAAC